MGLAELTSIAHSCAAPILINFLPPDRWRLVVRKAANVLKESSPSDAIAAILRALPRIKAKNRAHPAFESARRSSL
jgi:hypothetical protein